MAGFLINPYLEPGPRPARSGGAVRDFHRSLPGYRETPLVDAAALARRLGLGRLLVKDESQRFGLQAFKSLGASWAMQRLKERGSSPGTVTTATDGNHGRAVAWAARRFGWNAVIFIPAHSAPARIEHLRAQGARVELVEGSYDDAVAAAAAAARAEGWQVVSDTGYPGYMEIPGWIADGYSTLFEEAREQRESAGIPPPDLVLIQAGVGSLLHAAVAHFRALPVAPKLVAVEPEQSDPLFTSISSPGGTPTPSRGRQDSIMAGLNCGAVSLAAWPEVRTGVDLFLTVPDSQAEEAMRLLGRDAGVEAGESGAAGLAGLLGLLHLPALAEAARWLGLGPATRVMVVNTEGATDPAGYQRVMRR